MKKINLMPPEPTLKLHKNRRRRVIHKKFTYPYYYLPEGRIVADRRIGGDRRCFSYTACIPERRGDSERRSSLDRRTARCSTSGKIKKAA
jgi:hypothetical protein